MQLVSENDKETSTQPNLIDAAFKNIYERIKNLNFQSLINYDRVKKITPYFAAILFCVCIIFVPGMRAASYRLVNFNKDFIPPAKICF